MGFIQNKIGLKRRTAPPAAGLRDNAGSGRPRHPATHPFHNLVSPHRGAGGRLTRTVYVFDTLDTPVTVAR